MNQTDRDTASIPMRPAKLFALGTEPYLIDPPETHLPAQAIRLIAYLDAQVGRAVTREEVCAFLWDTNHQSKARHSLSQLIYQIKSKTPTIPLVASSTALRL